MMNETFHFLRPEWLWALAGIPLLAVAARRRARAAGAWRRACDPELLPHLLETRVQAGARWALPALVLCWGATTLALAGPTCERLP